MIFEEGIWEKVGKVKEWRWEGKEVVSDFLWLLQGIKEKAGEGIVFNVIYGGKSGDQERWLVEFFDNKNYSERKVVGEMYFVKKGSKYYVVKAKMRKVVIFEEKFKYDRVIGDSRGDEK